MPKEKKEFKIGKISLEVNSETNNYVPAPTEIVNSEHELETIALGIKKNLPVLLIGETGTGKTSFIRYLANKTNNGYRRINLNGQTTVDELVGHYTVDDKEKGMRWVKGVLYEAMENGDWILLDELNAGLPEVLFALQSVLDDDKFLIVYEHEKEIIRPHKNFRVFATMNPSLEYAGTRDLNKALLSRFPIVIQTQYQDAKKEMAIIKSHVADLDDKEIQLMVRVAEEIRKGKKNNSLTFICSTRELINWAKLTCDVGIKEAANLAILNKCEVDSDKNLVEDILKMQFGKWDKKQTLTIEELEKGYERMVKEVQQAVQERDMYMQENHQLRAAAQGKSAQKVMSTDEMIIAQIVDEANSHL